MSIDTRKTVISGIKWLSIGKLIAQLVRWVATILVIQRLAPEDFGIAALAQSLLSIFELFTTLGLNAAIVQTKELTRRDLQVIFGMIVLINLVLAAMLWFVAPVAAEFYGSPELTMILRVLTLTFFVVVFGSVSSGLLARDMNFRVIALSEIVSGVIGAGVLLYLAYAGYGYWSLVWGGISIIAIGNLVKFIARPVIPIPVFNLMEARHFLTFGSLVMGSIIVRHLYVSLDVIIAGRLWTTEMLGVYAVALQLAVVPMNKIMPTIRQVAFPAYARNQTDRARVSAYLVKSMVLAMAIGFPVFYGIGGVAPLIVPLVLSETWAAATLPIMVLCIVIPFRMMTELFEPPLNAIGKPRLVFLNSLVILALMTPTFYVSAQWNVIGLCIGWLVVFPVIAMFSSAWYCRQLDVHFMEFWRAIRGPFLASLVMMGLVYQFLETLQGAVNGFLLLALAILIGVVSYCALIFLFDRNTFNQFRDLVQARLA